MNQHRFGYYLRLANYDMHLKATNARIARKYLYEESSSPLAFSHAFPALAFAQKSDLVNLPMAPRVDTSQTEIKQVYRLWRSVGRGRDPFAFFDPQCSKQHVPSGK
jgi:hypothetical protein